MMELPPPLIVSRLIHDVRPEVAGPLLEKAAHISDADLLAVVAEGTPAKQKLIARRRVLSPALTKALIELADQSVLLTVLRNQGALIGHLDFHRLAGFAKVMPVLQAPLVTRPETPPPVAFELFWHLPSELRRFVLSRFLTDSETLNRILKLAGSVDGSEASDDLQQPYKFADRKQIDEIAVLIAAGSIPQAAQLLAKAGGICESNAQRIICDPAGEPLAVMFKAMGMSRNRFGELMELFQKSPGAMLNKTKNTLDLQNIFDQLSFNKARMLLTYWDWSALQTGPYARNAA